MNTRTTDRTVNREAITAFCTALGLDPKQVANLTVTPDTVTADVAMPSPFPEEHPTRRVWIRVVD